MKRVLIVLVALACVAAAVWSYHQAKQVQTLGRLAPDARPAPEAQDWLDRLHSQNPRDADAAGREVAALGPAAIPAIRETLHDPAAAPPRLKSALKACAILGPAAEPLVQDVAAVLDEPGLTAEAAIALSYMGRPAYEPLRQALGHDNADVRREALRSIGKLKDRAALDTAAVVPLLVAGLADADETVRAVAATYLGIIHQGAGTAVPALTTALADSDPEVRRAAAAALGSFERADAAAALPALRKAAADRDEDVAREAGRALVKLEGK